MNPRHDGERPKYLWPFMATKRGASQFATHASSKLDSILHLRITLIIGCRDAQRLVA
jgi:hypothetical protein